MQIECKIKRLGGTHVTMQAPQREYHFTPIDPENFQSPHVAEVKDNGHISRFLSIAEGYQFFGESKTPDDRPSLAETVTAEVKPEPEKADTEQDTAPAQDSEPEGATETEANEPETDEVAPPAALTRVLDDPDNATREDAEEAFEFLEDRKPHPQSKTETIVKKVVEKAAEDGWIAQDGDQGALSSAAE